MDKHMERAMDGSLSSLRYVECRDMPQPTTRIRQSVPPHMRHAKKPRPVVPIFGDGSVVGIVPLERG